MNIERSLAKLIAEEGKNPLPDQQIAVELGISREYVNVLRKKMNIEPSHKRILFQIENDIRILLDEYPTISVRQLTKKLNSMGYNISVSFVNSILKRSNYFRPLNDQKSKLPNNSQSKKDKEINVVKDPFTQLIGFDSSLKAHILHAKAAVLYPPKGLDTIIVGETGVGKTLLARVMYEFAVAKGVIKQGKFIVFNCADYTDNIQLLYSHLFGHIKGAFTGADNDKEGLISQANEGIIFLDEVHRLPAEGQEMLFSIIDNGKYRRLGETDTEREVKVMVIAATTENIESELLSTFRRRIPMIIELPPLKDRSIKEKIEFIELIISRESIQIGNNVSISHEAYSALIKYNPVYNMGLLESELKVAIAKAYLLYIIQERSEVEITLDMLPIHIRNIWFNNPEDNSDISLISSGKLVVKPNKYILKVEDNALDIYKYLDSKNEELKKSGFMQSEINRILKSMIEGKINSYLNKYENNIEINLELDRLIGSELVPIIDQFIVLIQQTIPELVFSSNLKYALGLHIHTALERLQSNLQIIHPDLAKVKEDNPTLFYLSERLMKMLENHFHISIPEDETGYISMYLNIASNHNNKSDSEIEIIVVCHGKVASNMLDVAKYFIKDSKALAIDMQLDISPSKIYKLIRSSIKEMDCSRGIILLTDMGSLTTMGNDLQEELGIDIETIPRVDTMMLMDAMYWGKLSKNVTELKDKILNIPSLKGKIKSKKQGIVVYCITGEGSARHIIYYLKSQIPDLEKDYKIVYVGIIDEEADSKIKNLSKEMSIEVIIGNVPNAFNYNIPFITCAELHTQDGVSKLKNILGIEKHEKLTAVLNKNIIIPKLDLKSKEDVINLLCDHLHKKDAVKIEFKDAIYKRENWVSTYIGSGIALPHTMEFNSINYSQIAIAVLKEPIDWSGFPVQVVCMFAINEFGDKYFKLIYKKITDNLNAIIEASSNIEIRNIILGSYLSHE